MAARSELRIADLKQRVPSRTTLMNVKIPASIGDAIDRIAKELQLSKTEVVVALLNEGLEVAADRLKGLKAAKAASASDD